METLRLEEIKAQYPDQWILIGNPELNEPEVNEPIINKLLRGIVLYASKDKRELGLRAKNLKAQVSETVCIYTGERPKNRLYLV